MKRFGTISYNIYCNFTNYGSALQTWALHQIVSRLGYLPVLVDYCPDILTDKDPLNPFGSMWDKDEESKRMVELTMPAIVENYKKFDRFYRDCFNRTKMKYISSNFDEIILNEGLDGFICGSDTIFCPDEFGFDDGYYANYNVMKGNSVAYAASFGDPHFDEKAYGLLNERLQNFKALGIREQQMIPYIKNHINIPVQNVLDPTLLLTSSDYERIVQEPNNQEKYLLLYSRRYSPKMEAYAEKMAKINNWSIIDISLRAINAERGHKMAYNAGVEEFLGLIKNAQYVVTNSYHGMIFSIQFRRPFVVFSREQCDSKISELLQQFNLMDRIMISGEEGIGEIDYDLVYSRMDAARIKSIEFLRNELNLLKG